jgi:hypothetical protein
MGTIVTNEMWMGWARWGWAAEDGHNGVCRGIRR